MIRNGFIVYSNRSLRDILEVNSLNTSRHADESQYDLLKRQLFETKIIPYTNRKEQQQNASSATTVWQFLVKNEKGATFELPAVPSKYKTSTSKYITLNQVNVNISGT
jgi:hypothetical protein